MKALQYRFMKRELDADAYSKLYGEKREAYAKLRQLMEQQKHA